MSRLIKDVRFFKEKREELRNMYPYARAEKFNRDIRNLGVTESGLTFLDHFRQLITEIGNALGYVRMIRTGGINASSNGMQFIPDVQNLGTFEFKNWAERLSSEHTLNPQTIKAAENLDGLLNCINDQFAEKSDYLRILSSLFARVVAEKDLGHLKNFFIIVPPLTVNFLEKILIQKEKIGKKVAGESSFTDDGFALGLAYILRVLAQDDDFDTLHWFDSIHTFFKDKENEVLVRIKNAVKSKSNPEGDDAEALKVTATRLEMQKREVELLFFCFSGARIFFRPSKTNVKSSEHENSS
jgi:WASH complex subunit 7